MKEWMAFFICVGLLISLASCELPIEESTTEETFPPLVSSTTAKEHLVVMPWVKDASYAAGNSFSETPTRILFINAGVIFYYNQMTEEIHRFCFDPLCQHDDFDCISYKFEMAGSIFQSIEYCAYNNRFYALRGEQFCSFSFDGSDLKIEASFGEEGKFEHLELGYLYGGLQHLNIQGKYAFFLAHDVDDGKFVLMRYDVESGEMTRLFHDTNTYVNGYLLQKNEIYLSLVGTYSGLYRMDINGENMEFLSEEIYDCFYLGIHDEESIYMVQRRKETDETTGKSQYIYEKIVAFHPETGISETLLTLENGAEHILLASTERYLYYTVREAVSIGYYNMVGSPQEKFNDYSKIYRLDKESGEIVKVLDDLRIETKSIYFVEDTVFIMGVVCTPSESIAWRTMGGYIAKLDENGMFTELEKIK